MSGFIELLHSLAARPVVYNAIQRAAGSSAVNRRFAAKLDRIAPPNWVLDIGGGTGLGAGIHLSGVNYICLDIDPLKLHGFLIDHPSGLAVLGDAGRLPFPDDTVDLVLCKAVSHHLPDDELPHLFSEAGRVLKPEARFVFLDAIKAPHRWRSRVLWRMDRGSFPRDEAALRKSFEATFHVESWGRFAVIHEYVLGVGTPRPN